MAKANKKWEITHIAIRTWPNNMEKKGQSGCRIYTGHTGHKGVGINCLGINIIITIMLYGHCAASPAAVHFPVVPFPEFSQSISCQKQSNKYKLICQY